MHKIVEFLLTNSISDLEQFGIFSRWSTKNPRKVSLNYDQILAKDGNEYSDLCRGLILRQDHNGVPGSPGKYSVMALPFHRFYNYGTAYAAKLDWDTVEFEEKLDGTLCIVYWDYDLQEWCCGTRSVPDADIPNNNGDTFSDLFFRHFEYAGSKDPNYILGKPNTYCFELTGPDNQIVVVYNEWKTTLLSHRCTQTESEAFGNAKRFKFSNVNEAIEWINSQPGHSFEGVIARDAYGNRVKIKSAQYFAVSKVMTRAGSKEGMLEIVLSGTADDVMTILPENKLLQMKNISNKFTEWINEANQFIASLDKNQSRKDVALKIQETKFKNYVGAIIDCWLGNSLNMMDSLSKQKKNGEFPSSFLEKMIYNIGV